VRSAEQTTYHTGQHANITNSPAERSDGESPQQNDRQYDNKARQDERTVHSHQPNDQTGSTTRRNSPGHDKQVRHKSHPDHLSQSGSTPKQRAHANSAGRDKTNHKSFANLPWPGRHHHHKSTVPQTPEEKASPLHVKPVTPMDYEAIRRLAKGTGYETKLEEMLSWNLSDTNYKGIAKQLLRDAPLSDIPTIFVQSLISADIVEPTSEADAMRYGSLFTVYERLKHRQRFILWPKHVNSNVEYSADFSLPGTDAQIKEIRDIVWAITFDLTASFYQCELAPEVRPYFCFRTKEGIFRFKRMVMGFSPAAEIMDTILRVISTRATIDAGVPGTPTTYIDNVRYGHSSKVNVMTWGTSFRRTCQHAGITLNVEPGNTPHQLGTFLGVEFDYAAGTCRLTAKSLSKLNHIATFLHSNVTFDDIFELFGVLFF
jgi:hypothetical protein